MKFDSTTAASLETFRLQAITRTDDTLQSTLPAFIAAAGVADSWSAASARLFGNWLCYLLARKSLFSPVFEIASTTMARADGF